MIFKTLAGTLLAIFLLSGCVANTYQLDRGNDNSFTEGTLRHGQGKENSLQLTSHGQNYTATGFSITKETDWDFVNKQLQNSGDRKPYEKVAYGQDSRYTNYIVDTVAYGANQSEMKCRITWGWGRSPSGICKDASETEYPVHFK